jgi:hypothetical protein
VSRNQYPVVQTGREILHIDKADAERDDRGDKTDRKGHFMTKIFINSLFFGTNV